MYCHQLCKGKTNAYFKKNCEGKNLYVSDFGKIIEPGKKKGQILNYFFFQWTIDYQYFTLTINLVLISRILE